VVENQKSGVNPSNSQLKFVAALPGSPSFFPIYMRRSLLGFAKGVLNCEIVARLSRSRGAFPRLHPVARHRAEKERHAILFTHMAKIDMAVLTVLRPMPVVGKTWALAWVRIVAALPRRRENRMPHRYSGGRRRWPLLEWRLPSSIE
jgi:hypothetical protein